MQSICKSFKSKMLWNFATNEIPSHVVTNINQSCCLCCAQKCFFVKWQINTNKPTKNADEIRCKSSRLQQSNDVINLTKRRPQQLRSNWATLCLQLQQPASLLLLFRLSNNFVSFQSRCSESTTTTLRTLRLWSKPKNPNVSTNASTSFERRFWALKWSARQHFCCTPSSTCSMVARADCCLNKKKTTSSLLHAQTLRHCTTQRTTEAH